MTKNRRYSRRRHSKRRSQKGGRLVDADKDTLRQLGFTENDIKYIFGHYDNMHIDFFINAVNSVPGSHWYSAPQTPQQIMERLREEGDFTDVEQTPTPDDINGGSRRKIKKQKKTRKHKKRRQRGGNGFTTVVTDELEKNKENYNNYVRLNLMDN